MHQMQHTLVGCGYIHLHVHTLTSPLSTTFNYTLWPPTLCQHPLPTGQGCSSIHLLSYTRHTLDLLLYTRHQPLARSQAFNLPVCCLSKSNTPGQHHSGVPGRHQSPTPYPWVQQSSASQPNAEPSHPRHTAFSRSSTPQAQETASHHGMLEQLLRLLEADPLSRHDKLMLKAALTFGFFGFLRVSEYTLTNRGRFDPTLNSTKSDITWVKDGMHFFIKKSNDQVYK